MGGCADSPGAVEPVAANDSATRPVSASGTRTAYGTHCRASVRLTDGAKDMRSWVLPAPAGAAPPAPSGDLRLFEIRASQEGVCARWTLAAPPPPGTELQLGLHSVSTREVDGLRLRYGHGYGYRAVIDGVGGVRITGRLARLGSPDPQVIRGRIAQSGSTLSIFLPRTELDRRAANDRSDKPPFPYGRFTFEARVITPVGAAAEQYVDFAPDERAGEAALIGGRLCPAPCRRVELRSP